MPARLLFPEDRTSFIYQGPNKPILTPPRTALQLFAAATGSALADVTDATGASIASSIVYTGEDGLIPDFYGPSGAAQVWAKVMGADEDRYALTARYSELLGARPELLTSVGAPSDDLGVANSWCIDRESFVLYGPKGESGWPPGVPLLAEGSIPKPTTHIHYQVSASDEWIIDHPLDFSPSVTILDSFDEEVEGDLTYPLVNRVVARFATPFSGRAIMS